MKWQCKLFRAVSTISFWAPKAVTTCLHTQNITEKLYIWNMMAFSEVAPCFGVWEGKSWWIAFLSFSLWDSSGASNNQHCHLWVTVILSPKICMWLVTFQAEGSTTFDSSRESALSNRTLADARDSSQWAGASVPTIFETQCASKAQSKRQSDWGHSSTEHRAPAETGCICWKGKHRGHRRPVLKDLGKRQLLHLRPKILFLLMICREPSFLALFGAEQDSSGEGLQYLYGGRGCQKYCATVWGRGQFLG